MLTVKAHAKINLALEITGRRADGFHELVSVMQLLDLCDEITISPASAISLQCSDPTIDGSDNLAYRAASLFRARYGTHMGCAIALHKRIPSAAGLGGGSSDAASTLVALSRIWNVDVDCKRMRSMAEELGSDVPYFLYGRTALVTGRGEHVRTIREPIRSWYLLARPAVSVSTNRIFRALRPQEWSSGDDTLRLASRMESSGRVEIGANSLRHPLFRVAPEAQACFDTVKRLAPNSTFVSGSGPTVGAVFGDMEDALEAKKLLRDTGYWLAVTAAHATTEGELPCP